MFDIAVIFTCYNRKKQTIECVKSLLNQKCSFRFKFKFYICDDLSTDGTAIELKKLVPIAVILTSKGNLFLSKGMYYAMKLAQDQKHDFYMMINDDMIFFEHALQVMLDSYLSINEPCGIVGSILSLDESTITYGGRQYLRKMKMGRSKLIYPNGKLQLCDVAHWNCFMVTQTVIDRVGVVDKRYEHAIGDYDYSLRMVKKGFPIYVATDFVGKTDINPVTDTYLDKNLPRKERFHKMFMKKGRPIKSEILFYVKNHQLKGFVYFIYEYTKEILEILRRQSYAN